MRFMAVLILELQTTTLTQQLMMEAVDLKNHYLINRFLVLVLLLVQVQQELLQLVLVLVRLALELV